MIVLSAPVLMMMLVVAITIVVVVVMMMVRHVRDLDVYLRVTENAAKIR